MNVNLSSMLATAGASTSRPTEMSSGFDYQLLVNAVGEMNTALSDMDAAFGIIDQLDEKLSDADALTAFSGDTTAVKITLVNDFNRILSRCGGEGLSAAGLQSQSMANVGNQMLKSFADGIKKIIAWAMEKLADALTWAKKVFNAHFGSYESARKDWENLDKKAQEIGDKVLPSSAKTADFTKAADFYFVGEKVMDVDKLAAYTKKFVPFIIAMQKALKDEPHTPDQADLLDAEGKLKKDDAGLKALQGMYATIEPDKKFLSGSVSGRDPYTNSSEDLPGRVNFFYAYPDITGTGQEGFDSLMSHIKNVRLSILPTTEKQKPKETAKVALVDAQTISSIASDQMDLMDNVIDMVHGPQFAKTEKALNKLSAEVSKWTKQAPGDDADIDVKNGYRSACRFATAYAGYLSRIQLSMPQAMASYFRTYTGALYSACAESLKQHKKPE